MLRDLAALADARYDLLVIGGGIHGLFAAYDAADRGLSVLLVERADFGSGLSANHQRTIHGGLRALQSGHIGKVREQIVERRTWARIAPHLVRPLPFLIGTYRFTKRSRLALRAGFAAYDLIGRRRNVDVPTELHLPKGKVESAAATRKLFPGIAPDGLTGGAVWYDYQTRHPDRLNWTVALAADRAGAHLVNYADAIAPLMDGRRVAGARVRDGLTGREHDIQAAVTLIAAGGALGRTLQAFGLDSPPPMLRAMNVLLNRPARDIAIAARGASGRMLTAVPWRGFVLAGTHQSAAPVERTECTPPAEAIGQMLDDVNAAFPALKATAADIRLIHYGLTPATTSGGRADLLAEPQIIRHATRGTAGAMSLIGVKYTTSRLAAERAVDLVCRELGRPHRRCRTSSRELPHAGISDVEGRLMETGRALGVELDRNVLEHLASWYGSEAPDVVRFAAERGQLDRLSTETPVLGGEVTYAAVHGQAARLSDAILRRTALGSAGHPGQAALQRASVLFAEARGWAADKTARELADAEAIYPNRFNEP